MEGTFDAFNNGVIIKGGEKEGLDEGRTETIRQNVHSSAARRGG